MILVNLVNVMPLVILVHLVNLVNLMILLNLVVLVNLMIFCESIDFSKSGYSVEMILLTNMR